jgi:succinyl-CoA synthetase beta subunit
MSILIDKNSKVLVTGLTGRIGSFHAEEMRLSGTNVEEGRKLIRESGLNITTAETLAEAAEKVVAAWKAARSNGGAA